MPTTHRFHPWHDVPTGPNPPELLTAIVEIPRHSRNKYELDKELGLFRLDRLLHSAVQFPGDYGFLPRTLGDDGDPLDVLVIMTMPVFTGCLVEVRPVGIFHLVDRKANDEKIIAVPTNDPFASEIQDIGDLRAHSLREIEHFFEVYKDLEGARVRSRGFEGRLSAGKAILAAMANYQREFGRPGRKLAAKPVRRPPRTAPSKKKGPR